MNADKRRYLDRQSGYILQTDRDFSIITNPALNSLFAFHLRSSAFIGGSR
jgi:hypothetical protein